MEVVVKYMLVQTKLSSSRFQYIKASKPNFQALHLDWSTLMGPYNSLQKMPHIWSPSEKPLKWYLIPEKPHEITIARIWSHNIPVQV